MIVAFLTVALADAIPASHSRDAVAPRLKPLMEATGVFQPWGLFSPNPMTTEVRTFAVVTFDDGTSTIWFPSGERGNLDSNRNERWRKWEARVREDDHADLWPQTARHVAHRFEDHGPAVKEVDLVRRWSEIPLPEQDPDGRLYRQYVFYSWDNDNTNGIALGPADQAQTRTSGRP